MFEKTIQAKVLLFKIYSNKNYRLSKIILLIKSAIALP